MAKEVKVPLSKVEHSKLKSLSALKGISMREYCRKVILKQIKMRK